MQIIIKRLFIQVDLSRSELHQELLKIFGRTEGFAITLPQKVPKTSMDYYCYVIIEDVDNIDFILNNIIQDVQQIPDFLDFVWKEI